MGEGSQDGRGDDAADHDIDGAGEAALAPAYREALRLEADGQDHTTIAAALDVRVEAVPTLLVLARRKQARAARPAGPDPEGAGS